MRDSLGTSSTARTVPRRDMLLIIPSMGNRRRTVSSMGTDNRARMASPANPVSRRMHRPVSQDRKTVDCSAASPAQELRGWRHTKPVGPASWVPLLPQSLVEWEGVHWRIGARTSEFFPFFFQSAQNASPLGLDR